MWIFEEYGSLFDKTLIILFVFPWSCVLFFYVCSSLLILTVFAQVQ